eukprot:CAMPEP_0119475114 /NCGR_PEP_ID=MMETSP1344-20130328/6125_1 /TAXON_ID=236787 /ORGANISM="Florenciella parvula, Strain CCMP2471" /LENGTH=181 /DNA_ID=CAMNT_0007508563 /DNA_START=789 /DNA_END=1335 /DNA_ORIENTATION=+
MAAKGVVLGPRAKFLSAWCDTAASASPLSTSSPPSAMLLDHVLTLTALFFGLKGIVNLPEIRIEGPEQAIGERKIGFTHHLSARMHGQLRHTEVDRSHARIRGENRTDGAAARAVVANSKLLHWGSTAAAELAHHETSDAIGSVALVRVRFDDHTLVHGGGVALLVLRGIVGVDSVCHING